MATIDDFSPQAEPSYWSVYLVSLEVNYCVVSLVWLTLLPTYSRPITVIKVWIENAIPTFTEVRVVVNTRYSTMFL